jgi:hypothetical protein
MGERQMLAMQTSRKCVFAADFRKCIGRIENKSEVNAFLMSVKVLFLPRAHVGLGIYLMGNGFLQNPMMVPINT